MADRKENPQGRAAFARAARQSRSRRAWEEARLEASVHRIGEPVHRPREPVHRIGEGPQEPSRREVIQYTAERLECVKMTLRFRVLGRNGHPDEWLEIVRGDRGILMAGVNGVPDQSGHVSEALQRIEVFFRDMAQVTARTLNGRGSL